MSIRKLVVRRDGLRRRATGGPGVARGSSTRSSSSASWRASATRSTRWRRRSTSSANARWPAPNTCTPTGRWSGSTRCRRSCWRCRTSGSRPTGEDYVLAAEGCARRPSPTCATSIAERTQADWRAGCGDGPGRAASAGRRQGVFRQQRSAGRAARLHLRVPGPRGPGRPGTPDRARRRRGVLHGGHPGRHDHRRSPDHGREHRSAGGLKPVDEIITGPELDDDGRRGTAASGCGRSTSSPAWCRSRSCGW